MPNKKLYLPYDTVHNQVGQMRKQKRITMFVSNRKSMIQKYFVISSKIIKINVKNSCLIFFKD